MGMTKDNEAVFRARLLALREELLQLRHDSANDVKPVILDQAAVGRLSRMDAMQMQHMAMETARRRDARIARVDAALRRIENGHFGICMDCDEPIDERRLHFDPTFLKCIKCTERQTG